MTPVLLLYLTGVKDPWFICTENIWLYCTNTGKIWLQKVVSGGVPRGTLGNFGELFFGESQKNLGTFPKFPKIPHKFPKTIIRFYQ